MPTDGQQTDMTKLIIAFRNPANSSKMEIFNTNRECTGSTQTTGQ
jgi:hypothetical protein